MIAPAGSRSARRLGAAPARWFGVARESFGRIPRAALVCALVGMLNAGAWALLLPPLQAHDEQAHVYYVQYLAETGKVPRPIGVDGQSYSEEQMTLVNGLHLFDVVGNPNGRPPWTTVEQRALDKSLAGRLSRVSRIGGAEGVATYPPLYYGAAAVAYKIAAGGNLIDRIFAMRLVSVLFCGITVLFVFLFLRELLPRHRWVWPVGALAVAFEPVFAFISGAVNPDVALAAASAAVFYLIARAFRRGLTPRLGATIGLALALGTLSKVTMAAFVPGVALAGLLLALRARRNGSPGALRAVLFGAIAFAIPLAIYSVLNVTIWDRPLLPGGGGGGGGVGGVVAGASGVGAGAQLSLGGFLSYTWQDYLPRLSFMTKWFDHYIGYDIWFKSFWGAFGWGDYTFSSAAFHVVLYTSIAIMAGVAAAVVRLRRALLSRVGELIVYAVMVAGLLGLLGYVGYGLKATDTQGTFEQGRYLFPLLAPFAALVALGVIGVGQRVGRYLGVLVVIGSFALTFYAHLLTVARFYA